MFIKKMETIKTEQKKLLLELIKDQENSTNYTNQVLTGHINVKKQQIGFLNMALMTLEVLIALLDQVIPTI